MENGPRHTTATCAFCGATIVQIFLMRHKKIHHAAELAAAGAELEHQPYFFPGLHVGRRYHLVSYLNVHLQQVHSFIDLDNSNDMTERLKCIARMPRELMINTIARAEQQLNALKALDQKT